MANPDREFLDQIDRAWDERVQHGPHSGSLNAGGFGETIDALHQADIDARPSEEFRRRLRGELFRGSYTSRADSGPQGIESGIDGPPAGIPEGGGDRDPAVSSRRWWASHLGELAAMLLILLVVAAGAVIWQSGNNGDGDGSRNQPGGAGNPDDASDEVVIPTPVAGGVWRELTLEQAQALTPFNLVMPDAIPDGYEPGPIRVINLNESSDGEMEPRDDGEDWIFAVIPLDPLDGDGPQLELLQGNYRLPIPGMPATGDVGESEPAGGTYSEDTELDELPIDGIQVNRVLRHLDDAVEHMIYAWGQDEMGMMVSLSTDVDPNAPDERGVRDYSPDVETMIASIIAQRTSDEQPPQPPGTTFESESDSASATAPPASQPEIHREISFEEAQERTPFDLVDPRPVQDTFDIGGVMLNEPPSGDRYHATLSMLAPDGPGFEFIQENAPSQPPENLDASPIHGPEGDNPDPVQEEIEIAGLMVTRTTMYNVGGDQSTIYNWHQDGLGMSVWAVTENGDPATDDSSAVNPEELNAFVQSIVEARESDAAPEQSGPQGDSSAAVGQGDPDSLTLEEARRAVPFELVDISALPDELRPTNIAAERYEDGRVVDPDHPEADNPNGVRMHLATMPGQEPVQVVEVAQMTSEFNNPEGEMLDIEGKQVERVAGQVGGALEVGYIWKVGETNVGLLVTTIPPGDEESLSDFEPAPLVTEEHMTDFVRSTAP